jgi:hypothetical protein
MQYPTWPEIISGVGSVGAWITAWYAASKVKEIHVLINSRLSSLLELTQSSSFAAGSKAEKDKQEAYMAGQQSEKDSKSPPQ